MGGPTPPPGPLSDAHRALVWDVPEDPPAKTLHATRADLEGRHYLTSDEWNLHLFDERLDNVGGAYVGVGADQAYLFIGTMRAELAWLTDYDPWIAWLHRAFAAFFEVSADTDELLSWWAKARYGEAKKLLRKRYAGRKDRQQILFVYGRAAWKVHSRLRRLRKKLQRLGVRSYLTDPETYGWVRTCVTSGRIRPMVGDLLGDKALRGIGEASRRLGVPVRAFYLSNAEFYWSYRRSFKDNVRALHFDERSVVLRTEATKRVNRDYRYNVQKATNFQEWMGQDWVKRVRQVVGKEKVQGPDHFPLWYTDVDPVAAREARQQSKGKGGRRR